MTPTSPSGSIRRPRASTRLVRACGTVAVALLTFAVPVASAQSSRAEAIAAEKAEKARHLRPHVPSRAERWVDAAEDVLVTPPMVYPWIGSVLTGGLLAVGPGFHKAYSDSGRVAAHAAWSLRSYKVAAARVTLPAFAAGRAQVAVHGSWIDAPAVNVYDLGTASDPESRATFGFSPRRVGATLTTTPARGVSVEGGVEYLDVAIDDGGSRAGADTATTRALPGFGLSPTYTRAHVSAGYDWRDAAGYTRRGGAYRVEWQNFRERGNAPYSFRRFDAQVDQVVPLLRANWVLAFHGDVAMTDTGPGHDVPFHLMPDLGGHVLRGYPAWRFRDRHRLLLSGEYRWTPSQFVDMALFYDAGKVTARRSDLDLTGLRRTYGIGIRFHAPKTTVLRADFARTQEGFGLVLAFSPAF